jgi:hypothetical protein
MDACLDELNHQYKLKAQALATFDKEVHSQRKKTQQLGDRVRKAEQDLEVSRELNKCVKRDFEREQMKIKGAAMPEERVHEVERLKKLV